MKFDNISDIYSSPGYLLRRGGQLVTSAFDSVLGHEGITAGQMTILLAVHMQPGLQQRELATALNWDEATVGGMIKRLEASNYLIRQSSPRSSRGRAIYMTPEGEAFFQKIRPGVMQTQRKLLQGLSRQEREQLLHLLSKLLNVENSHYTPAPAPPRSRVKSPSQPAKA